MAAVQRETPLHSETSWVSDSPSSTGTIYPKKAMQTMPGYVRTRGLPLGNLLGLESPRLQMPRDSNAKYIARVCINPRSPSVSLFNPQQPPPATALRIVYFPVRPLIPAREVVQMVQNLVVKKRRRHGAKKASRKRVTILLSLAKSPDHSVESAWLLHLSNLSSSSCWSTYICTLGCLKLFEITSRSLEGLEVGLAF